MTLKKYQQKRSFDKTPEPKGKVLKNSGKPLTFMVHEHHASHLHYDLRLEMEGVLKSWAVPKGPSKIIGEKHLAVHVEDHPLAYGKFKGIIPKGNYGAGVVKIWDHGTYEPFDLYGHPDTRKGHEKAFLFGLKKGHISFIAHGKKLKGAYDLVQIKKDPKNWLLIKKSHNHPDKNAKPKIYSIKTAKKSSSPTPNRFSKLSPGKLPFKPMLAHLANQAFDREGWIFEIKWDGYRALADINKTKTSLVSRHGLSYNEMFSPILNSLRQFREKMILDGEVVVVDEHGRSDFQLLQNYRNTGEGNLIYYVYDIISYQGKDLSKKPLLERKALLQKVLPAFPNIKYSEHILSKGKTFFQKAVKLGIEGIMAKDAASLYQPGQRSESWLKIKNLNQQEAVICGFTEPRGSRKAFGALVLGLYKDKKLTYIGHTGTGFNDKSLAEMKKILTPLITKKSPFSPIPKTNMPVQWVKPKLICEVRFTNWTQEGSLRQPVFLGLRHDKKPQEVIREKAQIHKAPSASIKAKKLVKTLGEKTTKAMPGKVHANLQFSNLNKIFWPKEKYTKGDLIEYYQKIAPVLLPYLKDRPESLNRHPDGINGPSFFQKDFQHPPEHIKTVAMYSDGEDKYINYLLCQNQETLLYMANLGCIELNPWNSRHQTPDHPDYLIIDLDPLEVSFEKVIQVAQAAHKVLDKLKLPNFVKTSGASGMHIYIPLGAKYTTEQTVNFAKLLAHLIHKQIPKITSIERSPSKRRRKVYLDYLQNRQNQTVACAYSVRPKPHATVSTPLKWSEVKKGLRPGKFTIKNIFKRLDKVGDLWKKTLGKGINMNSTLKKIEKIYGNLENL